MPTKKSLLQRLHSIRSLESAWKNLRKSRDGKSHGLSGETIKVFQSNLSSNLRLVQQKLRDSAYVFSPLRAVTISKGKGSFDLRPLRIPEVRDRLVLKAIANTISPYLYEKYKVKNPAIFAYHSKLGAREAIEQIVSLYNSGKRVVLEADIRKFFDTVDRSYLLERMVYPCLPDDTIDGLIERGLAQEIGNLGELSVAARELFDASEQGIPQGNALSPLLSNVYLSPFDHEMLENKFSLVRYADDFVVMCASEEEANKAYKLARSILENQLKVQIYPLDTNNRESKATRIVKPSTEPLEFLSVRFNGCNIWPSRDKVNALKERIREVTNPSDQTDVISLLTQCRNVLYGWLAAFSYTDVDRYFLELDELVDKQLAYAFRKMGLTLRKLAETKEKAVKLSAIQRRRTGIRTCEEFVSRIRNR